MAHPPAALAPGDWDDGTWTGSLVVDEVGESRIFYTSPSSPDFDIGRTRVAVPDGEGWDT